MAFSPEVNDLRASMLQLCGKFMLWIMLCFTLQSMGCTNHKFSLCAHRNVQTHLKSTVKVWVRVPVQWCFLFTPPLFFILPCHLHAWFQGVLIVECPRLLACEWYLFKLCLHESSNPGSTHFRSLTLNSNPPMDVGWVNPGYNPGWGRSHWRQNPGWIRVRTLV